MNARGREANRWRWVGWVCNETIMMLIIQRAGAAAEG